MPTGGIKSQEKEVSGGVPPEKPELIALYLIGKRPPEDVSKGYFEKDFEFPHIKMAEIILSDVVIHQ